MSKTWLEKYNNSKDPVVKTIDKPWLGFREGSKMLISSPAEIDDYIRKIPAGKTVTVEKLRKDLAIKHGADFTCPLTTGIFLRIVAEKSFEEMNIDKIEVAPFWRIIDPGSKLASKLSFGLDFIVQMRKKSV